MTDLVLRARRTVTPDGIRPAAVVVRGGRIAAVADHGADAGDLPVTTVPDDAVLLPGVVDTHVHVNEPGRTEWEGFDSATRAAAAGGVTTILDMPLNSLPPTLSAAALAVKRAAARDRVHVDVGFWGGAVPGNVADLPDLLAAGAYGVKCFLADSGVPEFGHLDDAGLRAHLTALADLGGLLLVHAEDPQVLADRARTAGTSFAAFEAGRPADAETAAVAGLVDAVRATGGRAHVVHVASAGAVAVLAAARAEGLPVSGETCPHYLTFAVDGDGPDAVPDAAPQYKCCPPLRDRATRQALWDALADGTLSVVVSDHSPSTPDLKHLDSGDLDRAWGGIASVQLSLSAVWTGARARGHGLDDVARWMCSGPADLAGLPGKGRIAVGADADLVVLAPDEERVVDPGALLHRHPLTPYAGSTLAGTVRATYLAGRMIHGLDGGAPPVPTGRLLQAGAP